MAELRVVSGPLKGSVYKVGFGITTIGREQTNSIQINDYEMSRRHAELRIRADENVLVDLGSSNGTVVNGKPISTLLLKSGDQVLIGQTAFEFVCKSSPDPGVEAPAGDTVGNDDDDSCNEPAGVSEESFGSSFESSEQLLKTKSNLEVLYNAALAAGSYQSTENLLQRILDLVFCWISADRACILIREDDQENLFSKSISPGSKDSYSNAPFEIEYSIIQYVFGKKEGVVVNDISNDERFSTVSFNQEAKDRQIICAPINSRYGVRGVIYADKPSLPANPGDSVGAPFDNQQLKLMIAIGLHAAVSIENADHYAMMLQSERVTAVGNAMASLSHHIKNILQSINGGNHLIEEGISSKQLDVIRNGWEIVQRNQGNLSNLVLDMLTYSKSVVPMLSETNINELIAGAVKSVAQQAESANVKIIFVNSSELPLMQFEPELLSRAIQNVLLSSIYACRDNSGGVINVKLHGEAESKSFAIEISDNGISLTPAELDSIFDPLATSEKSSRIGLGMAVAKKIVNEFGGQIYAKINDTQGTFYRLQFHDSSAGQESNSTDPLNANIG